MDVPYRFETRTDGQTKSTLVEGWNMVKHLVRLWWSTRVGWGPERRSHAPTAWRSSTWLRHDRIKPMSVLLVASQLPR